MELGIGRCPRRLKLPLHTRTGAGRTPDKRPLGKWDDGPTQKCAKPAKRCGGEPNSWDEAPTAVPAVCPRASTANNASLRPKHRPGSPPPRRCAIPLAPQDRAPTGFPPELIERRTREEPITPENPVRDRSYRADVSLAQSPLPQSKIGNPKSKIPAPATQRTTAHNRAAAGKARCPVAAEAHSPDVRGNARGRRSGATGPSEKPRPRW